MQHVIMWTLARMLYLKFMSTMLLCCYDATLLDCYVDMSNWFIGL